MEFKIGDRVRVAIEEYGFPTGIIVSDQDTDGMYVISSEGYGASDIDHYRTSKYAKYLNFIKGEFNNWGWVEGNALIPLTIPDTKIGRRLHKNNILKIEDDKIFLKG